MKTKTYQVYKFSELPKEAQALAIENYRDINTDYEWYENDYEYYKEELAKFGFHEADISFSGFGSQGDGASFTCKNIDLLKWLEANKLKSYYKKLIPAIEAGEITGEVKRTDSQYVHYNTCSVYLVDNDIYLTDEQASLMTELERAIEKQRIDFCYDIYRTLEDDYTERTEDESIKETLEINDYDFTLNGKID